MGIKPIKTKADYRAVLKEIEALMAAKHLTPEGARLAALVTLVEAYEAKHCPISPLTARQMAAIRKAAGPASGGKVVSSLF